MAGEFGPERISTHPFDPGKSKGGTITLIHREGGRGTVVGEMSVKESGYDEENEAEQGGYSVNDSSNSGSSTGSSKRLDGRWDRTSSFRFDRGKTSPAFPRHDMSECSIA